jgi:environmental stress-induced protein Ves
VQHLPHAERAASAWKNGLGVTYEVARRDDASGMLWRVSIAVCESACPFSRFDGVDRQLLVISGDPMRLIIDGREVIIGTGDPVLSFPGEASVDCAPLGKPTYDLNVMTRRGSASATVTHGPCPCTGEGVLVSLPSMDAVALGPGETMNALADAIWIALA